MTSRGRKMNSKTVRDLIELNVKILLLGLNYNPQM